MWLACLIRTGNLPGYGQVPYCRTRGLMEQRFTFKDFFLFAILAVLAVLILLSMYQVDRQWEKMSEMQRTMAEQAKEMRSLRGLAQSIERRISSGAVATNTEGARGSAEESIPPAFQRAYAATKLPGYAPGDWLVQAFGTGLKTITPLVSTDAYAADIQNYVLESLLTRNPESLKWEGMLAKSWQVSPDGLTFTFQLRKGVKFSDGTDMTAEDVVFTFDFIMNPAIAAPRERAYYDKIKSVTAVDKYEVRFEFKEVPVRTVSRTPRGGRQIRVLWNWNAIPSIGGRCSRPSNASCGRSSRTTVRDLQRTAMAISISTAHVPVNISSCWRIPI